MKRYMLSAAAALCLAALLSTSAWAEDGPRLTAAREYADGALDVEYDFLYEDGQSLPCKGRKNVWGDHTIVLYEGSSQERTIDGMPSLQWTYAYDGAGRLTEETETWPSGNVYIARKMYGESGLLTREEWVSPETGTSGMDYTYDREGRLVKSAADDNGVVGNVYEYDCDEAGRITAQRFYSVTDWDGEGQPAAIWPEPVNETHYVYDDAGRVVTETFLYDGELDTETAYTYVDDPCFVIRCGEERDYFNDKNESLCEFFVNDSAGKAVLYFSIPGEPELTRDEAGRLVRAETEDRVLEFVYGEG